MTNATHTRVGIGSTGSRRGVLRRAFDRMVEAREIQARRYVNGYLMSMDDATLAAHGVDREELVRQGFISNPF